MKKTFLWRLLRERRILSTHKRVSGICSQLIAEYEAHPVDFDIKPKQQLPDDRIIWQYWAQGYEHVPETVRNCLASVDAHAAGYTVIRLSDANVSDYLDIPDFIQQKRDRMSITHFSDILRLMLLKAYGGIWMDATIRHSAPVPESYACLDFFAFRRDPAEPHYKYWRNVYAYYFGWAKGFRVNVLNSFIICRKETEPVASLCNLMLYWWRDHDDVPDYFFFQILFDVYVPSTVCPIVSDTLPHYLQQSIHDPSFSLMPREEIERKIPIHKMTYK